MGKAGNEAYDDLGEMVGNGGAGDFVGLSPFSAASCRSDFGLAGGEPFANSRDICG